ncbi:MAG: family hydrolase [Mucilaginibacter sp.]|nr:family hydrolase [Mucilaginibacter sp.]
MKKLIIFDLDGTLAESKAALDNEMAAILERLLKVAKVAVISGGDWPQFEKQVLSKLSEKKRLKNLSILPTCGTKYYHYQKGWKLLYAENFTAQEKESIISNLHEAIQTCGIKFGRLWGRQIEDRGSQVTFSALGQKAPLAAKRRWDPKFTKRKKIKSQLDKSLKDFAVNMGGATSIDITKPGIDKAYGIYKLQYELGIKIAEMMFIGDALFESGNDHPARTTGADCIQVRDPEETKRVVEGIIFCLSGPKANRRTA